jgi:sodium/hydrogen antiporter
LGPGTLLSAGLLALAAWLLLGFPLAAAVILGAALASTDPVMLRGLLRRPGLPEPVRLALRLESGLNDVVLLPIVLVAMPFLGHNGLPSQTEWARIGLDLFLLGPGAGIALGLRAIAALEMIRRRPEYAGTMNRSTLWASPSRRLPRPRPFTAADFSPLLPPG